MYHITVNLLRKEEELLDRKKENYLDVLSKIHSNLREMEKRS